MKERRAIRCSWSQARDLEHAPCGILPKKCRVAPSPLDTQTAPCDTWHRSFHPDGNSHSFHPDISHPEFCPADVPPSLDISYPEFYPADVPPSPDISQPAPAAGWERRTIQLPRADMSGSSSSAYLKNIRSRQFRFPGQLGSSDTRDSPDLFPPTIKKQTPTILTTKSPELTLIFNARYIRQDIPKSSQVS